MPLHGRFHSRLTHLHVADDVLEHDDRIVHNEPDRQRQRHQRELIQAVPSRYITANVPMMENGTASPGIIVAERFRRNRKMTITTRAMVRTSVNSTS